MCKKSSLVPCKRSCLLYNPVFYSSYLNFSNFSTFHRSDWCYLTLFYSYCFLFDLLNVYKPLICCVINGWLLSFLFSTPFNLLQISANFCFYIVLPTLYSFRHESQHCGCKIFSLYSLVIGLK